MSNILPSQPQDSPHADAARPVAYYAAPVQKHGALGIASFAVSLVMLVSTMAILLVAGYLEETTPGGMSEDEPVVLLLAALYFGALGSAFVGAILGLAGVLQPDHRRLFAVLGLVINLLVLVLGGSVVLVGAMLE